MSKHRGRRISRRTAERLLGGGPVDVPDPLTGLLAAAAAPPRDGELVGERAAVAAFLDATHRADVPRPRRPTMAKAGLAQRVPVKVATVAAAIFAVSGVAAVAATGHLTPHTGGGAAASTSSGRTAGSSSGTVTRHPASTGSSADHDASPSPSLVGLCHAYTAGAGSDHGKALDSPAFTALDTAAGGKTKVAAYCSMLLKEDARPHSTDSTEETPGKSNGHQDDNGHPTHPNGSPATHAKS